MAATSFDDLPTELVLKIVDDPVLTQQDLYNLAILSRRLNVIVIPILLSVLGLPNSQNTLKLIWDNTSFAVARNRPGLRSTSTPASKRPILDSSSDEDEENHHVRLEAAIMIAFELPPIRNIVCTFPQTFTDLTNLLLHLTRFQALLSRVPTITSVSLHFTGDHRYRHLKSNPRSAVPVPFADLFGDIVQSLVEKGCESLFLYNNSEQLQDDYRTLLTGEDRPLESRRPIVPPTKAKCTTQDVEPSQPGSSKKGKKNIFSRAKTNLAATFFTRQSASSKLSKSTSQDLLYPNFDSSLVIPHSGKLQEIHIQTPFALLPRCFPMLRDIIHSSLNTLTSITLSYILFDEPLFDSCLSSLFLNRPNAVTHLRIIHCHNIAPRSLLSFLRCFETRLEHLELDWHTSMITKEEKTPGDRDLQFPNLNTIIAPLDWVAYLLKIPHSHSRTGRDVIPLPRLLNLTIKCRAEDSFHFRYDVFAPLLDNILEPLYYQRPTTPRSTINLTLDLILDRSRPFQLDRDTVILEYTSKSSRPPTPDLAQTRPDSAIITSHQARPPKHWDLISKLELYPTYPPVNESQALSLANWVSTVFPAVEQVTLPLPFIPRLMPIDIYKSRQKDLAEDAAEFLKDALRLRSLGYGESLAWKTLVVGPWALSLEPDL